MRRGWSKVFLKECIICFQEDNKHRLTIQYRMHPTIGTLISHVFYNDEIQNGVEAQDRELCIEGYEGIAIEWD